MNHPRITQVVVHHPDYPSCCHEPDYSVCFSPLISLARVPALPYTIQIVLRLLKLMCITHVSRRPHSIHVVAHDSVNEPDYPGCCLPLTHIIQVVLRLPKLLCTTHVSRRSHSIQVVAHDSVNEPDYPHCFTSLTPRAELLRSVYITQTVASLITQVVVIHLHIT